MPHWIFAIQDSFTNIKQAILSDPCLKHFDQNCLIILQSDFLSKEFDYIVRQPGNDTTLTTAMDAYCSGSDFSFVTKDSMAVLHPITFGARHCHGNECWLHSQLGEGFSGDWAMNKCCHMLFSQRFMWTTNSYAIKFILSYDGAYPAILCLQMHLMCWNVDIVHQNGHYIFLVLFIELILRGSILASMVPRFTSLHAVAWPDLHPWNLSSMPTPKTLQQES